MKREFLEQMGLDKEKIEIDGFSLPVLALKNLFKEGYENLRIYKENETFALWGKNCTACFSEEQLLKRGGLE